MSHGHSHGGAPCGGHGGGHGHSGPPAPVSAIGSLFTMCRSRTKDRPTPVPNYSQVLLLCAGCGGVGQGMKRCGRCQVAYYCSQACQEKAWKDGHKSTCVKGGEKLQEEIKQLMDEGMDMKTCITGIAKRDPRTPAMIGVIKNLLMRHSNPEDSFELPEARQPEQQPGQPPQPAPLVVALAQLGANVNPQNASAAWILTPALQNLLLHDPIIDANQAYMRLRAQQALFEKEQEKATGAKWDVQAEAKELARFRSEVQQDTAGPIFALLMLHLLMNIARVPTGYGPMALRRLMFLGVDKVSIEVLGPHVLPLLVQVMQTARKPFFVEGGLTTALKGFVDEKQRGRGIWMTILCTVSPHDWFEYGTVTTIAQTLSEIIVPGLCSGQFEDFYFMYSDPDPLENLGHGFKNGGRSRSMERSTGSSACGRGFDLFGIMLLERIVTASQIWAKKNSTTPPPFFQALQLLTQDSRANACMIFVSEVLRPEETPTSDVVKELVESRLQFDDTNYPHFVTQVLKTWRSLTFAEKKPYFEQAFARQQRAAAETKTAPSSEQKANEAKVETEQSTPAEKSDKKVSEKSGKKEVEKPGKKEVEKSDKKESNLNDKEEQ